MFIADSIAPSYEELRPFKPSTTSTFPVYPDLADTLVDAQAHPDDTVAHVLGTCAGYAYSTADTVAMIAARLGLNDNRCRMIGEYVDAMFICSTAFLVQSQDGRVVILAYRGTEPANFINWLTDIDVYPEKVALQFAQAEEAFAVHGGFYRNVRATRYEVVRALQRALNAEPVSGKGDPMPHPLEALYITGHSLGAAMAALMAVMLVTEPAYTDIAKKLRAVYTFGQPMIGSPALAEACDAHAFLATNVLRYIYRRDVVTHLPPKDSGPFAHFGPEYQYEQKWPWNRKDRPTVQMGNLLGLVEAPIAFVARQLRWFRDVPFQYSLDDHGPQHYISALTPPGTPTEFGDYDLVEQEHDSGQPAAQPS
jgi:hypothetical protein